MQVKILSLTFLLITALSCTKEKSDYIFNQGSVFGTYYHIKYESTDSLDLKESIDSLFAEFDHSLSTYNPSSGISGINENLTDSADYWLEYVMNISQGVSAVTHGAFDITVGPLVNAWGFGFKNKDSITDHHIDSLLTFVGYRKIRIKNGRIFKDDKRITLDVNAIAKGYAVDIVADYLEAKGCNNYMVEIGGEVRAKGVNESGRVWRIGIDKPIDDPMAANREIIEVLELGDGALATSGNYRNFYIENGQKYAHTIDPRTGRPTRNELLSVSVKHSTCITADAYATGFMALGLDSSKVIVNSISGMEAFFIYSDTNGEMKTYASDGFKNLLIDK